MEGENGLAGSSGITDQEFGVGTGVLAIGGAVNSFIAQRSKNAALQSQIRQTQRAVAAGTDRAELAAAQQRRDRSREAAQLRDRLRVTEAETGLSVGTLDAEASLRLAENMEAIDLNLQSQKNQLIIGGTSNILGIQLQQQSPILAGISGGLTGLTAGLQIEGFGRRQNQTGKLAVETEAVQNFNANTSTGQEFGVTTGGAGTDLLGAAREFGR